MKPAETRCVHLSGALVDEYIVEVAVAEADEVAGHGVDGRGARVRQPLLKPRRRLPEALQEEVVQARREVLADLRKRLLQLSKCMNGLATDEVSLLPIQHGRGLGPTPQTAG